MIKLLKKILFSKIDDNDYHYRAKKFRSFIEYFLIILLFGIVFSDKLGGFTIAPGGVGAALKMHKQKL